MIRYTVTTAKPTGREYHGPGNPFSRAGLAKYHVDNSLAGWDKAHRLGFRRKDVDVQHSLDRVPIVSHSIDAMGKEGFAAPGVPHLGLDRLTWPQIKSLRAPDGHRIDHLRWELKRAHGYGMVAAIDLKGRWDTGLIEQVIRIANEERAAIYVKYDAKKAHLRWAAAEFRKRGVWTRADYSPVFLRPTIQRAPEPVAPASPARTFAPPSPPFIAARWHGGAQTPRMIVMHSTVGPTKAGSAKAIAQFFAREDNKTSAHYVVDAAEVYQCVGDHTVAYHCGHNQDSIGVEMCDMPTQTDASRWNDADHRAMHSRAATLVAQLCLAYDIPAVYVDAAGLKAGKHGITTHAEMSAAFHQSTHWDPGAWPQLAFLAAVRAEIVRLKGAQK